MQNVSENLLDIGPSDPGQAAKMATQKRNVLLTNLDLWSSDPSDGGQIPLEQEMVRLVVEAPLADGQSRAGVLNLI